jgi:Uma2 family endonuclease
MAPDSHRLGRRATGPTDGAALPRRSPTPNAGCKPTAKGREHTLPALCLFVAKAYGCPMASVALDPAYRRVSVEEFLEMDFGGAKAELEDGIIFMMSGGTEAHSSVAANVLSYLRVALRGSGCRPYGSDFAARTGERTVRLPDVSVHCGNPSSDANRRKQLIGDPLVVFDVLSTSTSSHDQKVKLFEYQELAGVRDIIFVDPDHERVRQVRRTETGGWADDWLQPGGDLYLASLDLSIPYAEIFARD